MIQNFPFNIYITLTVLILTIITLVRTNRTGISVCFLLFA